MTGSRTRRAAGPAGADTGPRWAALAERSTRAARIEAGRAERERVALDAHAEVATDAGRTPIAILREQDQQRVAELVPMRWGRMSASPFAFYRGAAAVMAADLAAGPSTGLHTQLCGDAHLSNFGVFAAPDRRLVFDLDDFDETARGPFEWDVKRLAASIVVAGRANRFDAKVCTQAARAAIATYRKVITDIVTLDPLDVWYHRVELDALVRAAPTRSSAGQLAGVTATADRKNRLGALSKLTEHVDGRRRIKERPPLIVRLSPQDREAELAKLARFFADYVDTLPPDRRVLLQRYRVTDLTTKVVGVGSVGTRCFVALLETGDGDALFLQVKEARPSAVASHTGLHALRDHGRRVVEGQHLLQSAPDVFLGWSSYPEPAGPRDYYVRQLWDGKASATVTEMGPKLMTRYGRLCGAVLARAHARAGDAAAISGYLGDDDTFDRAVGRFARRYAELTDDDHAAATAAIADGTIPALYDL